MRRRQRTQHISTCHSAKSGEVELYSSISHFITHPGLVKRIIIREHSQSGELFENQKSR